GRNRAAAKGTIPRPIAGVVERLGTRGADDLHIPALAFSEIAETSKSRRKIRSKTRIRRKSKSKSMIGACRGLRRPPTLSLALNRLPALNLPLTFTLLVVAVCAPPPECRHRIAPQRVAREFSPILVPASSQYCAAVSPEAHRRPSRPPSRSPHAVG